MKYTSYEELLDYALENADSFSLVWRNMAFNDTAFELINHLEPWLISNFSCDSWPGTQLTGDKARVYKYKVTTESIKLLECVDSVYSFLAPGFPEDLALYKDKKVLFGSVAHEGMAWYT